MAVQPYAVVYVSSFSINSRAPFSFNHGPAFIQIVNANGVERAIAIRIA